MTQDAVGVACRNAKVVRCVLESEPPVLQVHLIEVKSQHKSEQMALIHLRALTGKFLRPRQNASPEPQPSITAGGYR